MLQKFRNYLLGSHFKMYTNHSELRYLVKNLVLGGRIFGWLLLFQEYDFEVIINLGTLNEGPDHLSCILSGEDAENLDDSLLDVHLCAVTMVDDYFADIVQFLSIRMAPLDMPITQNK